MGDVVFLSFGRRVENGREEWLAGDSTRQPDEIVRTLRRCMAQVRKQEGAPRDGGVFRSVSPRD